jgi:hypothetical protein
MHERGILKPGDIVDFMFGGSLATVKAAHEGEAARLVSPDEHGLHYLGDPERASSRSSPSGSSRAPGRLGNKGNQRVLVKALRSQ